jgi:hypothetical protein
MQIVHFQIDADNYIKINERAVVVVYDHPELGNNFYMPVLTSKVTAIIGNTFETLNNFYVGVHEESAVSEVICL